MRKGVKSFISVYEMLFFASYVILSFVNLINADVAVAFMAAAVISVILISINLVKNENCETSFAITGYISSCAILILALSKTGF